MSLSRISSKIKRIAYSWLFAYEPIFLAVCLRTYSSKVNSWNLDLRYAAVSTVRLTFNQLKHSISYILRRELGALKVKIIHAFMASVSIIYNAHM